MEEMGSLSRSEARKKWYGDYKKNPEKWDIIEKEFWSTFTKIEYGKSVENLSLEQKRELAVTIAEQWDEDFTYKGILKYKAAGQKYGKFGNSPDERGLDCVSSYRYLLKYAFGIDMRPGDVGEVLDQNKHKQIKTKLNRTENENVKSGTEHRTINSIMKEIKEKAKVGDGIVFKIYGPYRNRKGKLVTGWYRAHIAGYTGDGKILNAVWRGGRVNRLRIESLKNYLKRFDRSKLRLYIRRHSKIK